MHSRTGEQSTLTSCRAPKKRCCCDPGDGSLVAPPFSLMTHLVILTLVVDPLRQKSVPECNRVHNLGEFSVTGRAPQDP